VTIIFIRLFFIFISGVVGYYVGSLVSNFSILWSWVGVGCGIFGALVVITIEYTTRNVSTRNLSAAVFGLMFGLFMSWLLTSAMSLMPMDEKIYISLKIITTLVFCYLGMVIAMHGKDEFNLIIPYVKFERQDQGTEIILLDTSVIIDGRVADICTTKFMNGRLIIPRFVLKELQQIADSSDGLKRNRGRRGLDILNRIQKNTHIDVKIHDEDFPDITDVDAKLVKLAKVLGCKIFTNDYNLNKISELQGVSVLNINDLANALRPVVLPGEAMEVRIMKEGKEHSQGIAYLDDGTMVVVDNARHLIGQTIRALVTSVLQTSAGRMIFAKHEGDNNSRRTTRRR